MKNNNNNNNNKETQFPRNKENSKRKGWQMRLMFYLSYKLPLSLSNGFRLKQTKVTTISLYHI